MGMTHETTITKRLPNLLGRNFIIGRSHTFNTTFAGLDETLKETYFSANPFPANLTLLKPKLEMYLVDILDSTIFTDIVSEMDIISSGSTSNIALVDFDPSSEQLVGNLTLPIPVVRIAYILDVITIDNPAQDSELTEGGTIRVRDTSGDCISCFWVVENTTIGTRVLYDTGDVVTLIHSSSYEDLADEVNTDINSDESLPFDNDAFVINTAQASFTNAPIGHVIGTGSPNPIVVKNLLGLALGRK